MEFDAVDWNTKQTERDSHNVEKFYRRLGYSWSSLGTFQTCAQRNEQEFVVSIERCQRGLHVTALAAGDGK